MRPIEEYTTDELISLYKRYNVYGITSWMRYARRYKWKEQDSGKPFILKDLDIPGTYSSAGDIRVFNGFRMDSISCEIERLDKNDRTDWNKRNKLLYEKETLRVINSCLYWFHGLFEQYVKEYELGPDYSIHKYVTRESWEENHPNPQELEDDLHLEDDINIENGLATDYQVYRFVWETLQYLSIEQLSKLLKFANTAMKKNWINITTSVGRKRKVCEIRQIDIDTGNEVAKYMTRNDIIEQTGITKSHLSQCIKTSKSNPAERTCWKKWIGKDGKKYGFVESPVN